MPVTTTLLLIAAAGVADANLAEAAPKFAALISRAILEPAAVAEELRAFSTSTVVPETWKSANKSPPARVANASLPTVLGHGMGDSCFNPGFKSVTAHVGQVLGSYATCIPTGDNVLTDTINGFLMNMDKSVDEFAKRVKADPKLAGGFNALGLSQGNNLIRGYIQKYNDPPVHSFMSICGINAGVAAFPQCSPKVPIIGSVCEALTSVLGDLAYNSLVQSILFQANYFRDPSKLNTTAYKQFSQLAQWNGEGTMSNATAARANWAKTSKFIWVRGLIDTVVYPNVGEQWGALGPEYPKNLTTLPMVSTEWYLEDAFGLQTADKSGKNFFEEFNGEHIRFTDAELDGWLKKYFA